MSCIGFKPCIGVLFAKIAFLAKNTSGLRNIRNFCKLLRMLHLTINYVNLKKKHNVPRSVEEALHLLLRSEKLLDSGG